MFEISGIAGRNGVTAERIVLVDGTQTAIGAGAPVVKQVWKGVAARPKTSPVCAAALFPGEDELVPLDGCQTQSESPVAPLTRASQPRPLAAARARPNI